MPRVSMHDFFAAANFTAGSCHFLHHHLPISLWTHLCTTFLSPTAFDIACAAGALVILWPGHPKSTHTMARQWFSVEHGAFRFEHAHRSRAYPLDRMGAVRLLHRSPLAEERKENARGDCHQRPSHRRCQVISRMDSSRGPKIERWTQVAFLGALEF